MDITTQLIGSRRYKQAINTDVNEQLQLEVKTKPIIEYNINSVVNQQDVFIEERESTKKYRFNGKLNIYTSNALSLNATSNVWNPLLNGTGLSISPNNWVMQILYPAEVDSNFTINYRLSSTTITSSAYNGLQYQSLTSTTINNNNMLCIIGVQNGSFESGDYIYLYSNSQYNPLQGIHKINTTGINGDNNTKNLTLDTMINTVPNGYGNFVRIIDPSFNDIKFNSPSDFSTITATDISGGTNGVYGVDEIKYTTITSITQHNLLVNDFVDIRLNTTSPLNGVWKVYGIVGNSGSTKFTIKAATSSVKGTTYNPAPLPKWRRLDGTPSEYYVRKFEVITSNDYDVYNCAFSTNTYSDILDSTIGTANDTWLFQFNKDVDTTRLVDYNGGELSELYYSIIKRSGKNPYDWSDVTSDWDFNYKTTTTNNGLEYISKNNSAGVGTVEKSNSRVETVTTSGSVNTIAGSKYVGDFVEYNRKTLSENTISDIIHRFGINPNPNQEGYYYKPFKKLQIKRYSDIIEYSESDENIINLPNNYVKYSDGSIAWRDLLSVGYFENGTNGVDYPFVNGSNYFYFNHNLYVRRQNPPKLINQNGLLFVTKIETEC